VKPAPTRTYAAQPPLRLVGLPPEQAEADHGQHDRPEHDAVAAEDRLGGQHQPEAERHQGDRGTGVGEAADAARALALPGRALQPGCLAVERLRRQHQPEAGVEQDPAAAEHGEHQEARAHPHRGQAEVAREPGRDAADDRLAGVAVGLARRTLGLPGSRGGRGGGGHDVIHRRRSARLGPRGRPPVVP
jgi:hypothetical protein